jgi:hypothetical protein
MLSACCANRDLPAMTRKPGEFLRKGPHAAAAGGRREDDDVEHYACGVEERVLVPATDVDAKVGVGDRSVAGDTTNVSAAGFLGLDTHASSGCGGGATRQCVEEAVLRARAVVCAHREYIYTTNDCAYMRYSDACAGPTGPHVAARSKCAHLPTGISWRPVLADRSMTQIKALSALQAIDIMRQKHGPHGVEDIKAALSPEARQAIYETALVPSDWIDVKHVTENLIVYDNLFGKSDGLAARELVREVSAAQFTGVYRLLFALTSPRMLIEKSARLWPRYYDQGESIGTMLGPTSASFRILGCRDMPKHHDWIILPSTEVALSHVGAKDIVSSHTQCVANGDEACVSEFRWR